MDLGNDNFGKLVIFFVELVIVIHCLSCIFINFSNDSINNWILKASLIDKSPIEIYVSSTYFMLGTIFTIGYGDIVAANYYERLFIDLLMLFGIFMYTLAISSISNYVYQSGEGDELISKHEKTLSDLKIFHGLRENFINKVLTYLKSSLSGDRLNKNVLFYDMPLSIKRELLFNIYQKEI